MESVQDIIEKISRSEVITNHVYKLKISAVAIFGHYTNVVDWEPSRSQKKTWSCPCSKLFWARFEHSTWQSPYQTSFLPPIMRQDLDTHWDLCDLVGPGPAWICPDTTQASKISLICPDFRAGLNCLIGRFLSGRGTSLRPNNQGSYSHVLQISLQISWHTYTYSLLRAIETKARWSPSSKF